MTLAKDLAVVLEDPKREKQREYWRKWAASAKGQAYREKRKANRAPRREN